MELATHGVFQGHEAAEVGALGLSTLPCEAPTCVRQVLAASFRSVRFGWCVVVRAGRGTLFAVDGHSPALAEGRKSSRPGSPFLPLGSQRRLQ
jgi:hypothetical protein